MVRLYWEDFEVGSENNYGEHVVTEAEIIEFGREFDPRPVHVDPEAAARGPCAGLIASGWQIAGWCMRMLADNVLLQSSSMGSPGIESLRWKLPVRPGDRLHVRSKVLARRVSKSRPQMGLTKIRFEVCNQHDAVVMEMTSYSMFGRNPGRGGDQVGAEMPK